MLHKMFFSKPVEKDPIIRANIYCCCLAWEEKSMTLIVGLLRYSKTFYGVFFFPEKMLFSKLPVSWALYLQNSQ